MTSIEMGEQAALAGAVGMILANDIESGNRVNADLHVLPVSHITYNDGKLVLDYLNSSKYNYFRTFTHLLLKVKRIILL